MTHRRNSTFRIRKKIYVPSYDRAVIADSGFIVALFAPREPAHDAAIAFIAANQAPIITIQSIIAEACFFLSAKGRRALLEWVARGAVEVLDIPGSRFAEIGAIINRYQDIDPDFADCALVWLASELDCRRILTLDVRDFTVFRIKGKKRFELIDWQTANSKGSI
jgi:uncharacterized protein